MAANPDISGSKEDGSQRGFCKLSLYLGRFHNSVAGLEIFLLANLEIKNIIRVFWNADFVFKSHQSREKNNSQLIASYSF
jgi:hypothetical protein